MADPFRLRILKELTTLLEGISASSNSSSLYKNDPVVFRGRNFFGDNDPLPMVSILENPVAPEQRDPPEMSKLSHGDWELVIQGFVEDDKENPTDPAYFLAADVVAALAAEKRRVTDLKATTGKAGALLNLWTPNDTPAIVDMKIEAPVCRPPDNISSVAYFWLRLTLSLTEDLECPYD